MQLIIVESPTKARTISKFLSQDYLVESSYGHVRDLPEKKLGIDIEHDFKPKYVIAPKAKKTISGLRKLVQKSKNVILATDEDREGEAIAWHLIKALGLDETKNQSRIKYGTKTKNIERIAFHEITREAIKEALKNPRQIDLNLVDAQQTRRILDRLVGYKLSPLLWKKVAKGLSAGRVQSVAVRLIVDREKEIQCFKEEEYWTINAFLKSDLSTNGEKTEQFEAILIKIDDKTIPKLGIKTKEEADRILKNLDGAQYQVFEVTKKEIRKNPLPPFTTSTLQQEASKKFRFSAKQTMMIAQQLYEGIEIGEEGSVGLITYMRTDSYNLSEDALKQAQQIILKEFGPRYALESPQHYKTKLKSAQEAHEAIRPTDLAREPETIKKYLDPRQYKLYNLIWKRTIACQMKPAIIDSTTVDILAKNKVSDKNKKDYIFRASGSVIKFDGWLRVYDKKISENILPALEKDDILKLLNLTANQHFTQPPPRYNEASLIKTLEDYGIGRPSTYAPILTTIQERRYVEKNEEKKFQPTEIGIIVNDLLVKHFPNIVDFQFTAKMEEDLDKIAQGEEKMVPVIKNFYGPFEKNLKIKEKEIEKLIQKTDKICPKCGQNLIIRFSRTGKFYACPGFPECRYTESIKSVNKSTGVKCPHCQKGEIIEKRSRKGKIFYACDQFPQCDYALWDKPINQKCEKCGSLLVETKSKKIKCPECDKNLKSQK